MNEPAFDSLTEIKLIGISIPFVELITTELDSTGAIAICVALRTPYSFICVRNVSQSSSGVKFASSLTPFALRSQGKMPLPYHVLDESTHAPRSLASSTLASVR